MTSVNATMPGPAASAWTVVDGLVWGYRFDEDGRAEPLDGPAATAALERQDSWIWLHFDLIDGRARDALGRLDSLPLEAREMLLGIDTRQRIETYGQVIAGVVTDFQRTEELDPRYMACWRFCMAPHAFISARRAPMHTMAEVHAAVLAGRRFANVLDLFDGIVHGFSEAIAAVAHEMAVQLDEVEDGLLDARDSGDFELIGSVRRKAVRLRRQATPLQAMMHRLLARRPAWFTADAADDCAQVAQRMDSLCADLGALQERAHALQDELTSREAALTNQRLTILSVATAVLVPPTLISGIFGMNVDGLPLSKDAPYGFLVTIGLMGVTILALLIVLRRMKIF